MTGSHKFSRRIAAMTTIRRLDSEYLEIDNLLRRLDTGEFDRQFASAEVKAGVRAALDERMLTTLR
jgi:hypothetical protein